MHPIRILSHEQSVFFIIDLIFMQQIYIKARNLRSVSIKKNNGCYICLLNTVYLELLHYETYKPIYHGLNMKSVAELFNFFL